MISIFTLTPGLSFLQTEIICRTAQFFMHYFVGANYFWLLVEGIYLHTLLITVVLSERRLLQTYIVIGWGKSWAVSKQWLCGALLSQWRMFCKEGEKIVSFVLFVSFEACNCKWRYVSSGTLAAVQLELQIQEIRELFSKKTDAWWAEQEEISLHWAIYCHHWILWYYSSFISSLCNRAPL